MFQGWVNCRAAIRGFAVGLLISFQFHFVSFVNTREESVLVGTFFVFQPKSQILMPFLAQLFHTMCFDFRIVIT